MRGATQVVLQTGSISCNRARDLSSARGSSGVGASHSHSCNPGQLVRGIQRMEHCMGSHRSPLLALFFVSPPLSLSLCHSFSPSVSSLVTNCGSDEIPVDLPFGLKLRLLVVWCAV